MSDRALAGLVYSLSEWVRNVARAFQVKWVVRQLVAAICLVSILFSSPAVTLAAGNITNIDNSTNSKIVIRTVYVVKSNDTNFVAGTVAGALAAGVGAVAWVSTAGTVTGLSAAGISAGLGTIGAIVGGGMAAGLVVSAALPTAGVVGGLMVVKGIESFLTSHSEKTEPSIATK